MAELEYCTTVEEITDGGFMGEFDEPGWTLVATHLTEWRFKQYDLSLPALVCVWSRPKDKEQPDAR